MKLDLKKILLSTAFLNASMIAADGCDLTEEEQLALVLQMSREEQPIAAQIADDMERVRLQERSEVERCFQATQERLRRERLRREEEATRAFFESERLKRERDEAESLRLALEFQAQEERRTAAMRDDESLALARRLQEEDARRVGFVAALAVVTGHQSAELQDVHQIEHAYARSHGQSSDVHAYNKAVVRACYPRLKAVDAAVLDVVPNTNTAYADIFKGLEENAEAHGCADLLPHARSFNAAFAGRGHWGVEGGETGLPIGEVLQRCWDLANMLPDEEIFAITTVRNVTPKGLILFAYSENHETGGGCTPGFAGRIYRTYLQLVNALVAHQ